MRDQRQVVLQRPTMSQKKRAKKLKTQKKRKPRKYFDDRRHTSPHCPELPPEETKVAIASPKAQTHDRIKDIEKAQKFTQEKFEQPPSARERPFSGGPVRPTGPSLLPGKSRPTTAESPKRKQRKAKEVAAKKIQKAYKRFKKDQAKINFPEIEDAAPPAEIEER